MQGLTDIRNFYQVTPLLGTSGMPRPEHINRIADEGYELLVNLALPSHPEAIQNEGALVSARGMTYVHIPVEFDRPTPDDFGAFAAILDAWRGRKVFVHCAMNYRVSAFVFLYRVVREGLSVDEARLDLEKLWQPDPVWQDLIEEVLELHGLDAGDQGTA